MAKNNPFEKDKFTLKDSGTRQKFGSGAVRDTQIGKGRFDLISPFALLRLARVYEKGAVKYTDRNWEKGIPISRFVDSAFRHLVQYMMGLEDEDHLAQAIWNLVAIAHLEELRPDLQDMPGYLAKSLKVAKETKDGTT